MCLSQTWYLAIDFLSNSSDFTSEEAQEVLRIEGICGSTMTLSLATVWKETCCCSFNYGRLTCSWGCVCVAGRCTTSHSSPSSRPKIGMLLGSRRAAFEQGTSCKNSFLTLTPSTVHVFFARTYKLHLACNNHSIKNSISPSLMN